METFLRPTGTIILEGIPSRLKEVSQPGEGGPFFWLIWTAGTPIPEVPPCGWS